MATKILILVAVGALLLRARRAVSSRSRTVWLTGEVAALALAFGVSVGLTDLPAPKFLTGTPVSGDQTLLGYNLTAAPTLGRLVGDWRVEVLFAPLCLTYEHYTASTTLACSDSGVVNCLKVTTSAQSKVFGISVVLPGLVFFAAMIGWCLPAAWRDPRPIVRHGRIVAALAGIGFVFYLLYAELFIIDNICLWCTGVHVLTVALFAVVLFGNASLDTDAR